MRLLEGKTGWALLGVVALVFPLFAQNNYLISVATQTFTDRGKEFAAAAAGLPQPSPEQAKAFAEIAQQQIFTEGSTNAFLVGSLLMLAASAVIWIFLDVKHEELATDGPEHVAVH